MEDKKEFHINVSSVNGVYTVNCLMGGKMQDFLLESVKLQRIDLFLKLVAVSDCTELEKNMAIEWVAELTDELMARLGNHEYSRSMH